MIAAINLPGSKHFDYFHGSRQECDAWLEDQKRDHQQRHGGVWVSTYFPARVVPDKEATAWKYRDGSRVIK